LAMTLPEHDRCDNHRKYRLSCQQLENLIERSGQRCEICRTPSARTSWQRLHIDHCGPLWAVRGLLCGNWNICLEDDKAGSPEAKNYLANAWWERRCAAIGVPTTLRPEPPIGSAIRNQFGVIYIRRNDYLWDAERQNNRNSPSMQWDRLYRSYGPHNLEPFDLRAALDSGSLEHSVGWALKNAAYYAEVRAVLGIPEPTPKPRVKEWSPRQSLPWLETPEATAAALRRLVTPEECAEIARLLSLPAPNSECA
jgi:Recombination endonuclease VII